MSPPTATPIHSPAPLPATFRVSHLDKSSFETPATKSQPTVVDRPQRKRTPTPRGLQFQDEIRRTKALSAKIQQTKARKLLGQGQGGGKGQGKRREATAGKDARAVHDARDADSDESEDDENCDSDGSWIVDDTSDEVVPTSDPRELEQEGGTTFQTQLDDPEFCADITKGLTALFGETQKPTRQTLKKVLHLVRRDQEASLGSSQWYTQANSLPEQAVEGGGGYHLDYEPQPGQKRRFVVPQLGPSKRGCLDTSGTPSTVLDENPNPIPRPAFPGLPRSTGTSLLPRSATDGNIFDPPPGLPVSATDAVPEDTQTVPEDTQTVPDDTQTVPDDTQTVPEETQPMLAYLSQPRASQQPVATAQTEHRSSTQPSPRPSQAQPRAVLSRSASQLDAMSARFDNNERHRARAYQILQQRKEKDRRDSGLDDDDLMEDDEVEREEARNSAAGKPARRKRKSGLNCQTGRPRQAATRAVTSATAYTYAKLPYYTRGTGIIWSLEAYERAFTEEFPSVNIEPPSTELISAICDRIPGGRTVLKGAMRSSIATSYGLKQDPETKKELDSNLKIYGEIQEDFHMGANRRTHYEHPALKKAFLAGFFAARHSPCVIFHVYFNPVPVETLALLLVMMETCIAEWRTGNLVKEHLNAKEQAVLYEKHLANLMVFGQGAPDRLNRMRKDFYAAGIQKFAPKAEPGARSKATIRLEDIRADSPPPDGQGAGDDAS